MSDLLQFTTEAVIADYDRLREDCGLVDLPHLGLLAFEGDDRKGWLQGQVTNNLRNFDTGASTAFCFCEPTGHTISVLDVWSLPMRMVATLAASTIPAVILRTQQMVIMEDVTAVDLSKTYRLLSVQGPRATSQLGALLTLPKLDAATAEFEGAEVYVLRSNRTGMGGWDVWVPGAKRKALSALKESFTAVSAAAYDVARLEAGVPIFGQDMTQKNWPPEMGNAFSSRHISHNKGCYTGQEVLMRMHSRGQSARQWVGLVAKSPLTIGDTVIHSRKGDVGTVTSAGFSPDYGHIAAAIVKTDAAFEREIVNVRTQSGTVEAEVRLMPILRLE